MCRRKSKMLHGICDLLRRECEMPDEICDFGVEKRNAAQNLGFPTQKKRKAMRFWDPPRGKCESCAEFGDFPWKCEMLTEPGIFCVENTKCRAGLSIFCPERTKIRSGFAILSLAAAKSP